MQARGTGIETPMLHFVRAGAKNDFVVNDFPEPPGLDGRAVQGARLKFESLLEAWVRIPLQAFTILFSILVSRNGAAIDEFLRSDPAWGIGLVV